MDDLIKGVLIIVTAGTLGFISKMIYNYFCNRNSLCVWHRKNVTRLMFTMDAVLDYIQRDAVRQGVVLNGRYTRAEQSVNDFIKENDKID